MLSILELKIEVMQRIFLCNRTMLFGSKGLLCEGFFLILRFEMRKEINLPRVISIFFMRYPNYERHSCFYISWFLCSLRLLFHPCCPGRTARATARERVHDRKGRAHNAEHSSDRQNERSRKKARLEKHQMTPPTEWYP